MKTTKSKNRKAHGGHARAESLSSEQRSEIAKKAAIERWSKLPSERDDSAKRAICGSPEKMLKLGNVEIECYVL